MSRTRLRIGLVASLVIVLCGCPDKPTPEAADSGAQIAAVVDAGPPPLVPLEVRVQFDVPDAGIAEVELAAGRRVTAPSATNIQIETNQPVLNYRVRLFDEVDKVVPSNDSATTDPERLHYV